jgi:hypothetical protein
MKEAALEFRHFSGVTEEYLQNTSLECFFLFFLEWGETEPTWYVGH